MNCTEYFRKVQEKIITNDKALTERIQSGHGKGVLYNGTMSKKVGE